MPPSEPRADSSEASSITYGHLSPKEQPQFSALGVFGDASARDALGTGWLVVTDARVHLIDVRTRAALSQPWLVASIGDILVRNGGIRISGLTIHHQPRTLVISLFRPAQTEALIGALRTAIGVSTSS